MADPTTISMFNAAIDRIEKVARVAPKEGDDLALAFVYSGGVFAGDAPQRQIPAIYLTAGAAVDDWRDRIIAWLTSECAATFRFAEVPKVEKLIMTETGEDGAQRLTATRYGVTSKVAVLSKVAPFEVALRIVPAVPGEKVHEVYYIPPAPIMRDGKTVCADCFAEIGNQHESWCLQRTLPQKDEGGLDPISHARKEELRAIVKDEISKPYSAETPEAKPARRKKR